MFRSNHYIKQYNTPRPNVYNLTLGGDGMLGYEFSEDHKRKLSEAAKRRWRVMKNEK